MLCLTDIYIDRLHRMPKRYSNIFSRPGPIGAAGDKNSGIQSFIRILDLLNVCDHLSVQSWLNWVDEDDEEVGLKKDTIDT